MSAKITLAAFIATLALLVTLPSIVAQSSDKVANGASDVGTKRPSQGLVEYAFHSINPEERNYGVCFDDARKLMIEETIQRILFWSNVAAIGIAICLWVVVIHQHRVLARRQWMTADVITQYRNALQRAEEQIDAATQQNQDLMQALNGTSGPKVGEASESVESIKQRKTPAKAASPAPTAPVPATTQAVVEKKEAEQPPATKPTPERSDASVKDSTPGSQIPLFGGAEGDFVAKINTLQQQLSTSQERERQLRRQLNDAEIRWQKGREKSRNVQ